MGLRDRQTIFASAAAELILRINNTPGYACTLGDAFRDPRVHGEFGIKQAYGRANSVHKLRMAIDLNLFVNGEYTGDTEAHRPFGEWWEENFKTFDSRWGGRFNDGNHYSFRVWGSA